MGAILLNNVTVWDGESDAAYPGEVLIEGNRIKAVAKGVIARERASEAIDGGGMFLMPGMVEGHCHPSFVGVTTNAELGRIAPEPHTIRTVANVKLLLDIGFTSIFEAASAKPMIGVAVRDAINEGTIPGPRMRAASPEVTATAGLGDERRRHIHEESFGLTADGPIEFRRVARECVRDGVDNMKINISGDEFVSHARAEVTTLADDELAAFVAVAHGYGKMVAAHARSSLSVKMAVRHKVDCIYHCDFADEEALDLLESVKDTSFVGPAFGLVHNCAVEGEKYGMSREVAEKMHLLRKFEATCATYHKIRKRGIRVVVGGDYGFTITPMGQNARDIGHFVKYFGYSPAEALRCATKVGAALMGHAGELGVVKEGALADLLLVDGSPLQDQSVLVGPGRFAMIMKDGQMHRDPREYGKQRRQVAAE
ncbi:MAG: amidohydrolase family protein [Aestuariivirga sp.]